MAKLLRLLKNAVLLVFVLILSLAYYELADRSGTLILYKDVEGNSLQDLDPHTFFYVPAIFVVLINLLISGMAKLMLKIPLEKFKLPHKDFWFKDEESREKLYEVFLSWIYGLALIINVFVIACIVKIWFLNRGFGGQLYEYGLLSLVFIVILVAWIGFLFYRLRIRREEFFT